MKICLLWYPKCGTCRKAKQWLEANEIPFKLRDLKEECPTVEELRTWYKSSGLPLKKFFNTSGMVYKSMGLKDRLPEMGEEEQLALLASDGMLVKRPILVTETGIAVGFREEIWESLFG